MALAWHLSLSPGLGPGTLEAALLWSGPVQTAAKPGHWPPVHPTSPRRQMGEGSMFLGGAEPVRGPFWAQDQGLIRLKPACPGTCLGNEDRSL